MPNQIRAIIFDFGNVLVKWDVQKLYQRFFPDSQSVTAFLEEIHFAEWNAHQDAGRSFREGVVYLSNQFPHYAELIQAYDTYWEESLTIHYQSPTQLRHELKKLKILSERMEKSYE